MPRPQIKDLVKTAPKKDVVCEREGDDRHCPLIIPEDGEFYIRTGTQMSCANTGAANFLKKSGLSFLDIDYTDIVDQRSTASTLFKKRRANTAKFTGKARVKFSLVAWTTVQSMDQKIKMIDPERIDWTHADTRKHPGQYFRVGGNPDYFSDDTKPLFIRRNLGLSIIDYKHIFTKHFLHRQKIYSSLTEADVKANPPRLPPLHPNYATVLPPLAPRVHALYYDDDVIANAGEAALNCLYSEDHGVKDPEYSKDFTRCLTQDPIAWKHMKATRTPKQIAQRNKSQLLRYFEEVYNPNSSHIIHKPWEGSDGSRTQRSEYGTPRLIYSTHFAVQSCQEYVNDLPPPKEGSRKTARDVITFLKEKITIPGQKDLLDLYEEYVPDACRIKFPAGEKAYCRCHHATVDEAIELVIPERGAWDRTIPRNIHTCYILLSKYLMNHNLIPKHFPMSPWIYYDIIHNYFGGLSRAQAVLRDKHQP